MVLLDHLKVLPLLLHRQEFLMDNLECVTHRVVLSLESSETSQYWVIDSFYQYHFLERVVVLSGFVLLVPSVNGLVWHLLLVVSEVTRLNFVYHQVDARLSCLLCRLLNNRVSHHAVFVHQVAQELRTQTNSVAGRRILLMILLEENSEPWVSIEPLGTEVAERVSIGHILE